jgi:hypothetical protein
MAQIIKIKRGTQSQLDAGSLSLGEMAFTTDTKRLYVGNGLGKSLLSTSWNLLSNNNLQYNDGNILSSVAPTASDHLTNKDYVDNLVTEETSGAILKDGSRDFEANQSMGGYNLTNLNTPSGSFDAATKNYVDELSLEADLFETDEDDNLMPFSGSKFIFDIDLVNNPDEITLTEDGEIDADFEIDDDGNVMPKLERVNGGSFV